jgi:hydroxymethylpyrimidine/phosphomethylpyrimidine kinase
MAIKTQQELEHDLAALLERREQVEAALKKAERAVAKAIRRAKGSKLSLPWKH